MSFGKKDISFNREAKRVDIAEFLQGVKRHIPFRFRVPGQTVARITTGQYRRGYIRIGCQEFIGKNAELLRDWALRSGAYSRRKMQRQCESQLF